MAAGTAERILSALGLDYIKLAFETAHAADPSALLIYNDYGAEGRGGKSDFVYKMLESSGLDRNTVGGVGLQMHIERGATSSLRTDPVEHATAGGALGLRVNISEIDCASQRCRGSAAGEARGARGVSNDVVAVCVASRSARR